MTESKQYCNRCGFETKHDDNGCIYHQLLLRDSEGIEYLRYDEFNQDGEEL